MKQITFHNGPLSATGHTKTEAATLLTAKVTAALSADYSPLILTHGARSILIWREPTGICSTLFEAGHCGPLRATCCHETARQHHGHHSIHYWEAWHELRHTLHNFWRDQSPRGKGSAAWCRVKALDSGTHWILPCFGVCA